MSTQNLDRFRAVSDNMRWKGAAISQCERFEQFTTELGLPWTIVGSHTSQSISLPVICITSGGTKFYLRDNFHDINLCVVSDEPITFPMAEMFEDVLNPLDWDWYIEQVARCRGYSWRDWTDEQMDMPGLLALSNDAFSSSVKSLDEKARWLNRMSDPAWFKHDWSRDTVVWEGEFGPGVTMWVQGYPFMQGISELVPRGAEKPYAPGCTKFALALGSLDQAKVIIERICGKGRTS